MAALAFLRVLTDVNRDHEIGPYSGGLREFSDDCWWPLSYQHFLFLLLLLFTVVCTQLEARKVDSVEWNLVNSNKIFFSSDFLLSDQVHALSVQVVFSPIPYC